MKYLNRRRRNSSWRSFLSCSRNRSCRVCFLNHDSGRSGKSRLYVCPSQATASGTLNGPHSSTRLTRSPPESQLIVERESIRVCPVVADRALASPPLPLLSESRIILRSAQQVDAFLGCLDTVS